MLKKFSKLNFKPYKILKMNVPLQVASPGNPESRVQNQRPTLGDLRITHGQSQQPHQLHSNERAPKDQEYSENKKAKI